MYCLTGETINRGKAVLGRKPLKQTYNFAKLRFCEVVGMAGFPTFS